MDNLTSTNIKGYELRERLGAGGFGAVYKAFQSTVGREVAIKIILAGFANRPEFIRRFETEAQLIARLEHPYITPLYDYWRDPDGAYLVMRWLRGGSLRDALQNGAYDLEATAQLLEQITSALSVAHRNNVIHRDLKPGNILLDEDGNAYLADFGIAKDLGTQVDATAPDAVVGSLDYLSPEQARSEPVTPRTDIYSLGVVLYELLTGKHPYAECTAVEKLYKHLNDPLPDLTTLDPAVQANLNAVVQKATAKNPAHRYADALEFIAAFRQAAALHQVTGSVVELLTLREQEVLERLIAGLSNKEIAQELFITVPTVKWYVTQIFQKLHVRSRVQAIVRARELNLVVGEGMSLAADSASSISRLPEPENPYKGLRAFQTADARDFFGREALVQKLVGRLSSPPNPLSATQRGGENATHIAPDSGRFLAVVGPSGSGKSSLVKAGIIPALLRGDIPGSERWFVVEMLPGERPLDELEVALIKIAANQAPNLGEQLRRDRNGLLRAASLILPHDSSELVLVIDQFEEVFTLVEDEAARAHFLELIHAAVTNPRSRVRVVITLRADFYDRPLHYPEFGELIRSQMETILPLTAEGLARAIAKPAEQVGLRFAEGLVTKIVGEVNYQPGALPLLQYALTELFERRDGRMLTHEAYLAIGGTVGALAKRAEEIYEGLSDVGKEAARQMFLRLVTLGEGTEDTRRRTARAELLAIANADSDVMDEIIDTYAAYRLLSLDNDPGTRTPTIELAHEAIIREWERMRAWLNDSRDDIKLQRQLSHAADEWRIGKKDTSFLLTGSRLETFEKWGKETQLALTPLEHDFLQTSLEERTRLDIAEKARQERESRLERRSQTFLRGLVAVFAVATIIAVGLSLFAFDREGQAQRSAAEAQNVALINGSQAALANGSIDQAIALAIEAVNLDPNSARAQVALSEASYAPGTIRILAGHTAEVNWVEFSPNGLTALSASHDGTLILWDIATGSEIRRFEGHTDKTDTVAFTPDGLTAISGSYDTTMIQWDIETGDIIRRFEGQPDEIWAVAISPDVRYVASGGSGNTMILRDIQTGEIVRSFAGHTAGIESIVFSADGSKLLTASGDYSVILWEVATGQIIHQLKGHTSTAFSAVFSPDNRMIASVSDDGWTILWDVETGEIIKRFSAGGQSIYDVVFSPDGHALLEGGVAGVVLWNIETSQPLSNLRGHGGTVKSVAFNPNGRMAVSAAADGTLRLWDLEKGQLIRRFNSAGLWINGLAVSPDGHTALATWFADPLTSVIVVWDVNTGEEIRRDSLNEFIPTVAFSPDSHTALLGLNHFDGTPADIIVWDVNTGEEIRRFSGHLAGITSVAFNPDGRTVASNDRQGTTIVWDVNTGEEIRRFDDGEDGRWISVNFSPDGQTLAATNENSVIVLWDIATGAEIRRLEGHTLEANNFVFSDDGKRAFSGSSDSTTILWDVASGTILHRFTDHSAQIPLVDMTSDGSLGIAGSADGTTLLWDLNSGELIRRYNKTDVFTPLFLPGNHTLLVNQNELWRIDTTVDELLAWTQANRYIPELTCQQRELYKLEPLCDPDGQRAISTSS